jgi:hypothetical protein
LGIGDGDWGLGPIPNPQSPIPNPQSPIPNPHWFYSLYQFKFKINFYFINLKIKNIILNFGRYGEFKLY